MTSNNYFESIMYAVDESYNILISKTREFVFKVLELQIYRILIPFIMLVIAAAILLLSSSSWLFLPALILDVVIFVCAVLLSGVSYSVLYNIVDDLSNMRKTDIPKTIAKNFIPYLKYTLVIIAIKLLYVLPILGLAFTVSYIYHVKMFGSSLSIMKLFGLIVDFILQFAVWSIFINREPTIASLKKSYSLVRKNKLLSLIFYLSEHIGSAINGFVITAVIVILIGLSIIFLGASVYGIFGGKGLVSTNPFSLMALAIFVLIAIFFLAVALVLLSLVSGIITLFKYFLWKRIISRKN